MSLIASINAIDSWEGYKYQGNVALYVILSRIKELLFNHESLNGYEVQIEGEEDFALLMDGQYKSLHQVKSGTVDLNDNDKFAFIAEIIQNGADLGYFHVNKRKSIPTDFLEKTCSVISNLEVEFQKQVVSKTDLSDSDNPDDFIVLESITPSHKKATKYSIIKYVTRGKKDRTSVENAIESINNELRQHADEIENKKRVFLASHPDEIQDKSFVEEWPLKFDHVKEVKEQGIKIIKDIIMFEHPDWTFADDGYCSFLYDQGVRLIEQYVTDFFVQKNKNGKCLISFGKFYELIFHDYYHDFDASTEFKYYLILKQIDDVFVRFRKNSCNQNDCEQCGDTETCNLLKQLKELSGKEIEEKHKLIFNLLLQEPTVSINNLPCDETIKIQLIELLKELSMLTLNEKNVISASLNQEFYWLSLDESRRKETLREKIQKGMRENPDKSFLYECDTLITSFLNNESFKLDGSNVNILEKEQLEEIRNIVSTNIDDERANCNKPKIIRLVDAGQVKGELS